MRLPNLFYFQNYCKLIFIQCEIASFVFSLSYDNDGDKMNQRMIESKKHEILWYISIKTEKKPSILLLLDHQAWL